MIAFYALNEWDERVPLSAQYFDRADERDMNVCD